MVSLSLRNSKLYVTCFLLFSSCANQGPITEFNQEKERGAVEEIQDDFVSDDFILFEDHTYKESIKTVQMYNSGVEQLSTPIFEVGSNSPLILSFDDLSAEYANYYYTLIHCNSNWEPSGLIEPEFMEGFFPDLINTWQHSFNTIIDYIRYELVIPNPNLRITKSGNFILLVYEDNKDQPVLTRRFMVNENQVGVEPFVRKSSVVQFRNYKQEIDFNVFLKNLEIPNPFRDVSIVVKQNGRWDNAIFDLKPQFIRNNTLEYNHERNNEFWGGNEFRKIDMKSMRYGTEEINNFKQTDDGIQVYLNPQKSRGYRQYLFEYDINGKFLIRNDDGFDNKLEPEYMNVHFILEKSEPIENGDVYILGELSEWKAKPAFKMKYDEESLSYRASILLKQGYYNYHFAVLEDGKSEMDLSQLEGTHSETVNEYGIFVYLRDRSLDYDRLIGIRQFSTQNF
ncbi:MAG: DUF5103 domain-containing protein [Bacteroidota bacterium]